ncbi:MAG: glucose-phosphatase [Patescibacteria group bacterium]|jgi:HAD superfamily hydrolase (TIGR01509 family)|nr:glucose-phosphatase [Patescibacteria group bacterium]
MITTLLLDFSRVLLLPNDRTYKGELNALHKELAISTEYSFSEHFQLNIPLLRLLETYKTSKELYIFTSGSIQNVAEVRAVLDPIFKHIFSAQELGVHKKDPQAYIKVATLINKKPEEILFIDDSPENIGAAQNAKMNAIQYDTFEKLAADLQKLL